jgi:hypothetical protein
MDVKFKQWDCSLAFGEYKNGRTALFLTDKAIKNYSENEGVLDVLIEHKVVSKPKRYVNLTHVSVPICELLIREII